MKNKKRLAYYRFEEIDPVNKEMWTAWVISIYAPDYEHQHVSLLLSVANGGGRCLMRFKSVAALRRRVNIPGEAIERLELAEGEGLRMLERLRADLKLIDHSHTLLENGAIVRTDTGEVIKEAERIIQES